MVKFNVYILLIIRRVSVGVFRNAGKDTVSPTVGKGPRFRVYEAVSFSLRRT